MRNSARNSLEGDFCGDRILNVSNIGRWEVTYQEIDIEVLEIGLSFGTWFGEICSSSSCRIKFHLATYQDLYQSLNKIRKSDNRNEQFGTKQ